MLLTSSARALRCWRCEGERIYEESWLTHAGKCCLPRVVRCVSPAPYCIIAHVEGASSFWITGCNNDVFIGCDTHRIPFNSTLTRCQCNKDLCNPIGRIPHCAATRRSAHQSVQPTNMSLRQFDYAFSWFFLNLSVLLRLSLPHEPT